MTSKGKIDWTRFNDFNLNEETEIMRKIKTPKSYLLAVSGILVGLALIASPAVAAEKPNILVIWGDDIGQSNISAYTTWAWSDIGHPTSTALPMKA